MAGAYCGVIPAGCKPVAIGSPRRRHPLAEQPHHGQLQHMPSRLACQSLPAGRVSCPAWGHPRQCWRMRSAAAQVLGPASKAAGTGKVAVVIVDHGSRRHESNEMLEQFAEVFRLNTDFDLVEMAHMEISEPSIMQAITKCVEMGAESVVVAPYFLSRGRHIQKDIPELVEEARATFPSIQCIIADPIGVDPLMAKLIEKRVANALKAHT
mmetsp:Transcript_7404/g.20917  ORF Transcript_7404/g.20917 Transcript_7404/m.20917 type:complete len:210 (+) Transcript_7404:86-715(+)